MPNTSALPIKDMRVLTRSLHFDNRGHFEEIFRIHDFEDEIPNFVQDNISYSRKNVLRGMHFQDEQWQVLTVLVGSILDITIDVNSSSESFLKTNVIEMKFDSNNQLLIPPGVAHGFCVTSKEAVLHYKSSKLYGDSRQHGISWNSTEIKNFWPKNDWILSERDLSFPQLSDYLQLD